MSADGETAAEPTVARIGFHVDIDASDVVDALNNNDGLILSFVLEVLERAGSTELLVDLRDRINDQLHPVG